MNAGSVVIAIQAVDEASGAFGKIQASLGLLGNTLQSLGPGFQQVGSIISGFAAGGPMGAAVAGIGQVVQGLQWSVDEAAKAETAWTDLQSTLHLSGPAWDEMKGKLDSLVESLRTTTTFSDTQLVGALQRMATYGMNSAQAMDALRAATELAAAKHIDLETAATAIGKAFEGNTTILRRYGVEVQTSASAHAYLKTTFDELGIAIKEAGGTQLKDFGDKLAAVGIQAFDAKGKMLPVKDIMTELQAAFAAGAIDGDKFAAITKSLGVTFDSSKAGAADFAGVLGKINEQYGGVAAAQAQTYAGAQERLKNAIQEMGEKIGVILIPALAGFSEKMIPVVDALTKGVVAVQDWINAVAKIPEVKAAVDAIGPAFEGAQKWFQDFADVASKELGPALQDMWSALKDLFDALSPIGEAFSELFSALTDGSDCGNILKDILGLIAENIRMIALAIRTAAPYIKMLATAFKDAVEFITPALVAIKDAIAWFLGGLRTAFQDFYDFLVGHSLWQDLWDAMLDAVKTFAGTIGTFLGGMFDAWQAIFSGGMDLLKTIMITGFDLAFTTIKSLVSGATDVLTLLIGGVQSIIQGTTKDWLDLVKAVATNIVSMKSQISDFWGWATAFWKTQVNLVVTDFVAKMDAIIAKLTESTGIMKGIWNDTLTIMLSETRTILQQIYDEMNNQVNAIIQRLEDAKHRIASGSIWPDMLSEMLGQTRSAMDEINEAFGNGLTGPSGIIPTLQTQTLPAPVPSAPGPAAAPAASAQMITVPISVYLDGQQIQSILEQRMISTLIRDASRSKRG